MFPKEFFPKPALLDRGIPLKLQFYAYDTHVFSKQLLFSHQISSFPVKIYQSPLSAVFQIVLYALKSAAFGDSVIQVRHLLAVAPEAFSYWVRNS